ncbi:MAG: asparagine synthase (glutamine-hydrolyzing) [Planctomycetia bacterium]|nr:asparagine synthase (glutamine-hydrolyzing) [Planctomycetia bacterium]
MCGLVGWVGPDAPNRASAVAVARDLMVSRGPDDAGIWHDAHACLGFRRLSILDLTAAGHQPMILDEGRLALVFNGEIYNFRELRKLLENEYTFRSHTDTEVLLHGYRAWGWEGLLDRVDGMFAIALWDADGRQLHLARDRLGKKPLFYARTSFGLAFASTLEALRSLAGLNEVDLAAVDAFLVYQAVPAPLTFFRGASALLPAHALTYSLETRDLSIERYWDVAVRPLERMDESEAIDHIDHLLRTAVRRRLIADVPVGAFLSGGIDSGLVTAMMAQEGTVETVTLGFAEAAFDERIYARQVAARWGLRTHETVLNVETLVEQLPRMLSQVGQPHADMSLVATDAVAAAAHEHFTVVLNGDGGDEVFGGYARPVVARAAAQVRRIVPGPLRVAFRGFPSGGPGPMRKIGLLLRAASQTPEATAIYTRGLRGVRAQAYAPALWDAVAQTDPDALYHRAWGHLDQAEDAERALYLDLTTYLPDQLLSKMDTATMAHSLEARSPLLDRALVEFGMRLPIPLKLKGYQTKFLLKRLAERYLPRDVIYRRKQGFVIPLAAWLRGRLLPYVEAAFRHQSFVSRDWLRAEFLSDLMAQFKAGDDAVAGMLWTVFVLAIWAALLDGKLNASDSLDALLIG